MRSLDTLSSDSMLLIDGSASEARLGISMVVQYLFPSLFL